MRIIGLTGGIGMGKSFADSLLRKRGVPVTDTDLLARQIVEPGQPALDEIRQTFGPQFIAPDGHLLRSDLARLVFADPNARLRLEAILHPKIRRLWRAAVEVDRAKGHPIAVIVIPLLFETHAEKEFDATICVACSPATQRQRLLARGWSVEEIEQRIRAQWPVEDKIARADYLIWTEADPAVHEQQLDRILRSLNQS
jgi:dephospho-CoA kinase